jgi:hypothetical protein
VNPQYSREEIQQMVERVVRDRLCLDDEESNIQERTWEDLGADKLTVLDITFWVLRNLLLVKLQRGSYMSSGAGEKSGSAGGSADVTQKTVASFVDFVYEEHVKCAEPS